MLLGGKVLVAGGYGLDLIILASAELYDPATGRWTSTGHMGNPGAEFTATLHTTGKVLVSGGQGGPHITSEFYVPASGTWSFTGNLVDARSAHSATLLPDASVLVAGGFGDGIPGLSAGSILHVDHNPLASAETGNRQTR